jgi:hypothetical protein
VGATTADGGFVYVRPGSEPRVGLVPASTARGILLRESFDWRDLRFLPFPETRARRVVLYSRGRLRVDMARTETGWQVLFPRPGPASDREVGEYLKSISHMHIRAFPPAAPNRLEEAGLRPPRAAARVELTDGSVVSCEIGNPWRGAEDLLLGRRGDRPEIVGVSPKYLPVLEQDADAFREPLAVTFGLKDADSVEVVWGKAGRVIPRPLEAGDGVRDLLGAWLLLEAEAFGPGEPETSLPRGAPVDRLVWYAAGDTLAVEDVGRPDGERLPLRVTAGERARPYEVLFLPRGRGEDILRRLVEALSGSAVKRSE